MPKNNWLFFIIIFFSHSQYFICICYCITKINSCTKSRESFFSNIRNKPPLLQCLKIILQIGRSNLHANGRTNERGPLGQRCCKYENLSKKNYADQYQLNCYTDFLLAYQREIIHVNLDCCCSSCILVFQCFHVKSLCHV